MPLFALPGVEGRLFVPIGIAYVTSLLASLVVSLTLTPVLCSYLLAWGKAREDKETWLVARLKALDRRVLERTLEHPGRVAGGTALVILLSVAAVPFLVLTGPGTG